MSVVVRAIMFCAFMLLISCGSPRLAADSNARSELLTEPPENATAEERLAFVLKRKAGVLVNQSGENYWVVVLGGVTSFRTTARPLYVVDGHAIGYDFSATAMVVGQRTIGHIKVLQNPEATLYGIRASGGVIEIETKLEAQG